MDPILFDVSAYLAVAKSPVKTPLTDALGAEVKEIVGYQAAVIPSQYSVGGVRDISVCLPSASEVIQPLRYTWMAKSLYRSFGAGLLVRTSTHLNKPKSDNMYCSRVVSFEATGGSIDEVLCRLFGLSGFGPKRTLLVEDETPVTVVEITLKEK